MIQGTEIAPGLWALQNSDTERNTIVLFDEGEGPIVAVDPGAVPVELDALERFAEEMGRRVGVLVFTREAGENPALERWPGAIVIVPSEGEDAPSPPPKPDP